MSGKLREYRLARAWSQEKLAEIAGLSTRTVQRIENGEQASLETLSALAAVFEVNVSELSNNNSCPNKVIDERIMEAHKQLALEWKFYRSVVTGIIICVFLFVLNRTMSPDSHWSLWVSGIWGALIAIRGVRTFIFSELINKWQQKRIQKIIRKK